MPGLGPIRSRLFDQPVGDRRPRRAKRPVKDPLPSPSPGELADRQQPQSTGQLPTAAPSCSLRDRKPAMEACAGVQWLRMTLMQARSTTTMILKGSQRAGGKQLAAHLLKVEDNEHVHIHHELRGFMSDTPAPALHGLCGRRGTRAKQFLFL